MGAAIGTVRQPPTTPGHIELIPTQRNIRGTQEPIPRPASVKKHAVVGGVIGFVLDVAAVAATYYIIANSDPYCDGSHRC